MANLLDKANILITPTAYSDGKIHSAKPIQSLSAEKVVNGDYNQSGTGNAVSQSGGLFVNIGGSLKITSDGSSGFSRAVWDTYGTSGQTFIIKANIVSKTGSVRFINVSNNQGVGINLGSFSQTITLGSSGGFLGFGGLSDSGFEIILDNLSIKEIIDSDLNFTRGSAGTRVNEQGLIENSQGNNTPRINYKDFQYEDSFGSEEVVNGSFDTDSDWTKGSGWTISGGKAISSGNTSNLTQTLPSINANKSYTITFDLLDFDGGQFFITFGGNDNSETYQGNGTYELVINPLNAVNNIFYLRGNSFTGSVDNVSVKEVTKVVTPNSGVGSWLIEGQSTNILEYSSDFSNSAWTKQTGITPTYNTTETLSPNGTYNSTKFIGNGSSGVYSSGSAVGVTSRTVYLKSIIGTVNIILKDPTLTVSSKTVTVTTEWQRFDLIEDNGHSSLKGIWVDNIPLSGVYMWGAQVEEGNLTSYIPTNGSVQTRLAETASRSGLGDLIDSTQGVFYAEIAVLSGQTNINRYISINNGTDDNSISFHFRNNNNNQIRVILKSGNVNQFDITYNPSGSTDFAKVAFKYKVNDFSLWVNGIEIATDTSGITFSTDTLNKLSFDDSSSSPFYGKAKTVALFPILTDEELECLTTR